MFISCILKSGAPLNIVLRSSDEDHLYQKRFRGKTKRLAGNFSMWESPEEVFENKYILTHLLDEMHDIWRGREFGKHSLTIEFDNYVGWSNTDEFGKYRKCDMERFNPNRNSIGFRVMLRKKEVKAPLTKDVTIVWDYMIEGDEPTIVIRSIYPGPDVGEILGDVSARENCVFFDFHHVGA